MPVKLERIWLTCVRTHTGRVIGTANPTPPLVHFFSTNVPYSLPLNPAPPFPIRFHNPAFLQLPTPSDDYLHRRVPGEWDLTKPSSLKMHETGRNQFIVSFFAVFLEHFPLTSACSLSCT
jgi:hypothetical protein